MIVTDKDTARSYGSGLVDVLATPAMIALMEAAAVECVEQFLGEGQITVGTGVNIKHMAATPVGVELVAKATVCLVEGRLIAFKIEAFDNTEKVGEGTHTRFIVEEKRFFQGAQKKLQVATK